MLNNYMGIFYLALCTYLFVNRLLHAIFVFSSLHLLHALLPYPIAPGSISAPQSETGSLEVPAHGPGHCEFCLGRGSVLLEGPSPGITTARGSQELTTCLAWF
jgi:hypothetical protein